MASFDYIRSYYKVPAKRGGRVKFDGKPGTIVWTDGPYLRIRLDGQRGVESFHPLWKIEYLDTVTDTQHQPPGHGRAGDGQAEF